MTKSDVVDGKKKPMAIVIFIGSNVSYNDRGAVHMVIWVINISLFCEMLLNN